jgi:enoyl-CoA hydratase/carnithine racemase
MRTLTNRAKLIAAGAIGTRPYHLAELMDGRKHREPDMTNRTADNLGAIDRRNFLVGAGIGAAALAGAGPLEAQAADNAAATPVRETGAASEPETVKLERVGNGLLLIAIDRPEQQNLIDVPTFRALGRAYYEFEHDDALRVAVLHGQGADFSAGIDLQSWATASNPGFGQPGNFINPLATSGPARSKPVVCAVQGQVVRIAHELMLAADMRVAASNTRFNQGEVLAGAFPGGGATIRFMREAGWGNAMRYILTGEGWGADEAWRMGIVQEITPLGQQLDRAVELAKKIAASAPLGVRATLASSHDALAAENAAFAALEGEFFRLLRSEDRQEFIRAERENRPPNYVGR